MDQQVIGLGHLSTEEMFDMAGLDLEDFNRKSVLDIGCGFADLLSEIGKNISAGLLIGIDPSFKNQKTLLDAMKGTRREIDLQLSGNNQDPETRKKLKIRKATLESFNISNPRVSYRPDFSEIGESRFDYIFMFFVLTHLSNLDEVQRLITTAETYRQGEGKILIFDHTNTINGAHNKLIYGTRNEVAKGISLLRI